MKRIFHIFLLLASLLLCFSSYAAGQGETGIGEQIMEKGPLAPTREEAPEEEGAPIPPEDVIEEEGEEALPAERPAAPRPLEAGAAGEGEEARQIVIDSLVNMNYVFNGSPDSFVLKYHVHLEGSAAAATAVIKGNATIATEVTGFLAKWPSGNCKLNVNIADTPFQLTFTKSGEDRANIDLKFTGAIAEVWESQCTFADAPEAKFNTKGDPEKWLSKALEKARPPLTRLTVNLNPEEPTTMKFEIGKQTLKDPPLGTAEIEGTGVITINPGAGG